MISYLLIHLLLFCIVCIVIFKYDKENSIFSPVIWYLAFHFLVFVIKPILSFIFDFDFVYYYIGFFPSDSIKIKTLFITDIALVFFVSGFLTKRKLSVNSGRLKNVILGFSYEFLTPTRVKVYKFSAFVVASIILFSLYKTGSGFSYEEGAAHQMEIINGISINVNTTGYVSELKNMMTPFVFLTIVIFGFNRYTLTILLAYTLYRLYIGWERIHIVALYLNVGLFYLLKNKKRWFPPIVLGLIVLLIPYFSMLGENREIVKSFFTGEVVSEVVEYQTVNDKYDNLDFANYEYMTFIVGVVPDYSGTFSYWTQYLQLFTEPVPRILWSEKPIGMPIKLVELNRYGNFVGLTKSIVGDAWISLGFIGVILNFYFIGYFLRFLYERFFLLGTSVNKLFWLTWLPFSMQLFRDGGIVTISKFLLFAFLPLIIWNLMIKLMIRSRYESASSRIR